MAKLKATLILTGAVGLIWPSLAAAQGTEDLMALDRSSLHGEVLKRYDAALALTLDQAVVAADSPRFMWASQAKDQCGIALGFLKSGTKDPVSVGKCADASIRMQVANIPPPPPPAPVAACSTSPFIVFFDWDQSVLTAEAVQALDSAIAASTGCGNAPINAAGYADRSGSDSYNQVLSERRAFAVRDYLAAHGIAPGSIATEAYGEANPRVPTADGVREIQNRRVEVTFK